MSTFRIGQRVYDPLMRRSGRVEGNKRGLILVRFDGSRGGWPDLIHPWQVEAVVRRKRGDA